MAWEVFKRDRVPTGEPTVTLTSMGRIAVNKNAALRLQDSKVEHIELLWDKDARKVAIRPVSKQRGSYTLTFGDNSNGAGFSCTTFLNFIAYDWTTTRNFPLEWDTDNHMFIFEIPVDHIGNSANINRRRNVRNTRKINSKDVLNDQEPTEVGS